LVAIYSARTDDAESKVLAMTTETKPKCDPSETRDCEELRRTLFDTLDDLRAGRITVQEAKAVTTAANKFLCGARKMQVVIPSA
jgi:hypothetical protein